MKLLHRKTRISEIPAKVIDFVVTCFRALILFKYPWQVLAHYIHITLPEAGFVELRNGMRVHLAGHKHDLITVIVVFCKRDYGYIAKDSTVIDIGANIGAFSLYAAAMGARRIVAFEPNGAAYACLLRNIRENHLEGIITPFKLAVTGKSGETAKIPMSASPYNKIRSVTEETANGTFELVDTISLDDIVAQHTIDSAGLLKIDCEGAEYTIFPAAQNATLSKFAHIRMEYHRGPLSEMRDNLEARHFRIVKVKPETKDSGIMWLSQSFG